MPAKTPDADAADGGESSGAPTRRPRRIWRRIVISFISLGIVAAIITWSGWPQRVAVQKALDSVLGGKTVVSGVSLFKRVQINTLQVFDDANQQAADLPVLKAQGIDLDYSLLSKDGRYVPSLDVNSLALNVRTEEPGQSNYRKLERNLSKPGSGRNPLSFVPRVTFPPEL